MAKKKTSKKVKKDTKKNKNKKTVVSNEAKEIDGEYTLERPDMVYKMPSQDSKAIIGLEVYRTNEEDYVPYEPLSSQDAKAEEKKKKEEESEEGEIEEELEEETEDEADDKGYHLHMGEVLDTYYYGNLEDVSFESDYKDMNDNGTIKLGKTDLKRFYKGVRLQLKGAWKEPKVPLTWEDLPRLLLGFITEQTFTSEETELKIGGMTKCLEEKHKFDFTQMKRSEILREIILTAGLKPYINVDGLDDDVIDFKSGGTKDSGSSSDLAGGEGEEIDSLVAKICKGISGDLEKCKAIHQWLKENVKYSYYQCSNYHSPEECLKNKTHLNCADTARLTRAMMSSAGLKAYVVGRSFDGGHFWTIIEIDGKKYASDQTGSGSAFNTVWKASGRTTVSDGGKYSSKNGKNPSC